MANKIKISFASYDPDSENILLEYHLVDNNRKKGIALTNHIKEFGKIITTDKFIKIEEFKKTQELKDIKKKVSELTGFPIEIMTDFGYIEKKIGSTDIIDRYYKYDENNKDITDSILIKDSRYNDLAEENRKVFIFIDILKSPQFKLLNDNSIFEEVRKKIESLEKKYDELDNEINLNKDNISSIETKQDSLQDDIDSNSTKIYNIKIKVENNESKINDNYKDLNEKYNSLKALNAHNEEKIKNLENGNLVLKNEIESQQKEIDKIKREINNLNLFQENTQKSKNELIKKENISKTEFNKTKNSIEKKTLENIKKEILILKESFLHQINTKETTTKNYISTALIKYMKNFSKNIFEKSENFSQYINEYISKTPTNNGIDNINLILIGEENAGKSTLINEVLKLNPKNGGAKEADEHDTCTLETKTYSSEKMPKIKMIDTPGWNGSNVRLKNLLDNVNKLIKKEENKNNVILFCVKYDDINSFRFREKEVELIDEIMNIYQKQNNELPIIITVLQALEIEQKEKIEKMKNIISEKLKKYLKDKNVLNHIEIRFLVARKLERFGKKAEQTGLKELIETACNMKQNTIKSEQLAKVNFYMKELYDNFIRKKCEEIEKIINQEISFIKITLSSGNNYFNYYEYDYLGEKVNINYNDNVVEYLRKKIIEIFYCLNNINGKNADENIKGYLGELDEEIDTIYDLIFEVYNQAYFLLSKNFSGFWLDLIKEQFKINQKNKTKIQIENVEEIEKNFEKKYHDLLYKEFFETFISAILNLLVVNLKENIEEKYQELLEENENKIMKQEDDLNEAFSKLKQEILKYFGTETEK